MQKVLVAMSGGVDSSAAAILLQEQGYGVVGVTLKMFANEEIGLEKESRCCSLSDVEDARLVAHKLGFDHFVFNYCACFKKYVIDHFVAEYEAGRTPNPCVDCNKHIKFGELYQRARLLECDYLATGHYANVFYDQTRQRWVLTRGGDRKKDQSYMLFNLTQEQLAHIILPLGQKTKPEIRALAESRGLLNAKKPDSHDICFIPSGDTAGFLADRLGAEPGEIVDAVSGDVLGAHAGAYAYTVGQRRGLGLDRPDVRAQNQRKREDGEQATAEKSDHGRDNPSVSRVRQAPRPSRTNS